MKMEDAIAIIHSEYCFTKDTLTIQSVDQFLDIAPTKEQARKLAIDVAVTAIHFLVTNFEE